MYDDVCDEFPAVFEEPGTPPAREIEHEIHLKDPSAPIPHHRQYRMSPAELTECREQMDALLAKGWIRPSIS